MTENKTESFDEKIIELLHIYLLEVHNGTDKCDSEYIKEIKKLIADELPKPFNEKLCVGENRFTGWNDCLSEIKQRLGVE